MLSDLDTVWSFFSRLENLNRITPKDIKFDISSNIDGVEMYQGMLFRYRVSPFPLLPTNWLTEITAMEKYRYFIDEQRNGPYRLWHHEHRFDQQRDGILVTDNLHYVLPFGWIGQLVNQAVVRKRIDDIFTYRKETINHLFSGSNAIGRSPQSKPV
ncbi:MAG: SRPBCC family protein [Saprospiraceae bacterium]|nr:SRPBCC family protein [Saprospiraceae bacterium]